MSDNIEDNRTEGPEGFFVEGPPASSPAVADRRSGRAGRRVTDAELWRARRRLAWSYATFSMLFAAGVLVAVLAWRD